MRTRPGRSVSQMVPSVANASAQGATSPSATDFTVKVKGCGEASVVAVGVADGWGDELVAVDEPPKVQPLSTSPIMTAPPIRWDIVLMLAAYDHGTLGHHPMPKKAGRRTHQ